MGKGLILSHTKPDLGSLCGTSSESECQAQQSLDSTHSFQGRQGVKSYENLENGDRVGA